MLIIIHYCARTFFSSLTLCRSTVPGDLDHLDILWNITLIHYIDGIMLIGKMNSRLLYAAGLRKTCISEGEIYEESGSCQCSQPLEVQHSRSPVKEKYLAPSITEKGSTALVGLFSLLCRHHIPHLEILF